MKRFIGPLMVLIVMLLSDSVTAQVSYPVEDDYRGGGGPGRPPYAGGPRSLPLGSYDPHLVLAAALDLEPVQAAIPAFERRGYIRRPDQDAAFTSDNYAIAVIAWQKPGVSPDVRQPAIFVITKQVGDYYATQVFGGVVGPAEDGEHVRAWDTADDQAFILTGALTGGGSPRGTLRPEAGGTSPGEIAGFASAYDPVHWNPVTGGAFWNYASVEATGYPISVWQQYGEAITYGSVLGGLGAWRGTNPWPVAAWGAVAGWVAAHHNFWAARR